MRYNSRKRYYGERAVSMIDQAFARVLRRLRVQKGLSQEEMGEEAGLHRTYISQLERGLKSPSLRTLERVSNALGITLGAFMALVEQETRDTSSG
jgi:transcriptional regulator with XRE-family HTH domain